MKLTRRQSAVFRNFLDLYRELQGPIHYSALAERVGVSRITAYDMLRVLEEKGLVMSDYQRAADKSGPGRAEVVYWPTEMARERLNLLQQLAPGDWEGMKEKVLEHLQDVEVRDPNGHEIACEMLARIPPDGPPAVQYCVELMIVIALRLQRGAGRALLLAHLPTILPDTQPPISADLNLLCGFAVGVLLNESDENPEWSSELLAHAKQYHLLVDEMDIKNRHHLVGHMREVLLPLKQMQIAENHSL